MLQEDQENVRSSFPLIPFLHIILTIHSQSYRTFPRCSTRFPSETESSETKTRNFTITTIQGFG